MSRTGGEVVNNAFTIETYCPVWEFSCLLDMNDTYERIGKRWDHGNLTTNRKMDILFLWSWATLLIISTLFSQREQFH